MNNSETNKKVIKIKRILGTIIKTWNKKHLHVFFWILSRLIKVAKPKRAKLEKIIKEYIGQIIILETKCLAEEN